MSSAGTRSLLRDPVPHHNFRWSCPSGILLFGEGDVFIGIKVPVLRKLAAQFEGESLETIRALLKSKTHEERALALMILVRRFERENDQGRRQIYDLYLVHRSLINNWDLVDGSAPYILGGLSLVSQPKTTLHAGEIVLAMGAAHCDPLHVLLHSPE